jgi:hypothetical protein
MEIFMDFDKTEELQKDFLPSELDALEALEVSGDDEGEGGLVPINNERYIAMLHQQGLIRPELPPEERWDKMESDATRVYEEGLNNSNLPFKERRAVADKVFEIRGLLKKGGTKDENGGNTFVFSDEAAGNMMKIFSGLGRKERDVTYE